MIWTSESKISLAKSAKNFIDAMAAPPSDTRTVKKVIGESFKIPENSSEMQLLLYLQADNFERLLAQINLSSIEYEAKQTYTTQVRQLSTIVLHPVIHGRYDNARTNIIAPNYHALTYLNDALKIEYQVEDAFLDEAEDLAKRLQTVLDEISTSDLPLDIKSILFSQISQLIFLLRNIRCVGPDRVKENAASTIVTIQGIATKTDSKHHAGSLKSAAIVILAILAGLDQGSHNAVGFLKNLKEGVEVIERWRGQSVPQIEYKKPKDLDGENAVNV
ncbi:hypothetical protein V1291_005490 [Nitrobacteraceae bacterium AZCC 1564]